MHITNSHPISVFLYNIRHDATSDQSTVHKSLKKVNIDAGQNKNALTMLNSLPLLSNFPLVTYCSSSSAFRLFGNSRASSHLVPTHIPALLAAAPMRLAIYLVIKATRFIRTQIVLFENRFSSPFLSYTLPSFQSMVHCPLCAIPTKPTTRSTPCFNNIHSYNKSNKLPKPPLFSSTRVASLSRRPRGFFGGKQELLLLFLSAASVVFCSVLFTLSINSTLLFSSPPFPLPYLFSA